MKTCSSCLVEKEKSEFHLHKGKCKDCTKKYNQGYYQVNKPYFQEKKKNWGKANYYPRKEYWLKRRYGMSLAEYFERLEKQNNRCAICKNRYDELDVDHSHATNEVRELLCKRCNMVIGNAEEDIHLLNEMILYIKKHKERKLQ